MKTLRNALILLAIAAAIALLFQGHVVIRLGALGFTIWIAGPLVLACSIKIVNDSGLDKKQNRVQRLR